MILDLPPLPPVVPIVQQAEKPVLIVYTLGPQCPACVALHASMQDPRVQLALDRYRVLVVRGVTPGVRGYPKVTVGPYSFVGYKSPNDLLAWLEVIK